MDWIDVNEKHFAQITKTENGYSWESDMMDEPFIVAVKTNKGWCIQQVVLTDQIGLECWSDGETSYFGWDITDVAYWMELTPPND